MIGDHRVLRRGARAVGGRHRFLDGVRVLEVQELQVHSLGVMSGPLKGPQSAMVIPVDHRAVDGVHHLDRAARGTFHVDGLPHSIEQLRAKGGEVRVGLDPRLENDEIVPVGLGVGEPPGHRAVASRDDARGAGQGDTGDASLPTAWVREHEPEAVPDIRDRDLEVHVIRDGGEAGRRVGGVDRPVVAACVGAVVLGGKTIGRGIVRRHFGGGGASGVEDQGPGYSRHGDRVTHDGRVPFEGTARGEEVEHRGRQCVAQDGESALAFASGLMKGKKHGEDAQDGVLGFPEGGLSPEEKIFVRTGAEGHESGVHACDVPVHEGALARVEPRDYLSGHVPKPVDPHFFINVHGGPADEFRKFARRSPSHQVHLKEAFLPVNEAGGPRDVQAACP